MKGKNHLGKTISLLCMILMLSGLAAGCGNTTGFVSQSGDINAGSAELDTDIQESTENEQEQASDEEPPADTEEPADTASVEDWLSVEVFMCEAEVLLLVSQNSSILSRLLRASTQ